MPTRAVIFSTDTHAFLTVALQLVYSSCGPILVDGLLGIMTEYVVQTGDADKKSAFAAEALGLVLASNNARLYLKLSADSVEIGTEMPRHLSLSLSYSGGVYSLRMCEARQNRTENEVVPAIMSEAKKKGLDFKIIEPGS